MFIVSKKNFMIRRPDGGVYRIRKDWAGAIPDDVAESWLIQAAIRSGSIIASQSAKDRELARAEADAAQNAEAADIRPDADQNAQAEDIRPGTEETTTGEKKDDKKASSSKK